MTPYGRKPHANQYGSRRCREELHPVVAGRAQVQRETSAAFEEALDEMDGADDCAKNPVVPTPLRPWESVSAMDPVEAWDVDWFRLVEVDEQTLSPADRGRRKELVELSEHIQAQRYSVREIRAMQERIRWLEERLSDLESAAKETLADPSAPRLRLLIDLADLANPGNKP